MTQLALQLYTLRTLDEPLPDLLDRVVRAGYDGVQFVPDFDGLSAETVRELVTIRQLDVAGAHIDLDELEASYASTTEQYRTLGCRELVVPSYDRDAFTSETGVQRAADHLSTVAARLANDGFELHYHNHHFEFEPLGERTAFEHFVDRTADTLKVEIDTGLARWGGADPAALIERYGDRIDLVHLTDTKPGSEETLHVDLGTGVVDLAACIEAADEAAVSWLIYEHGLTDDPVASIESAVDVITDLDGR